MIKLKDIVEEINEQKEFVEFHTKLSSELNEAVLNQDMESELSDEEILDTENEDEFSEEPIEDNFEDD